MKEMSQLETSGRRGGAPSQRLAGAPMSRPLATGGSQSPRVQMHGYACSVVRIVGRRGRSGKSIDPASRYGTCRGKERAAGGPSPPRSAWLAKRMSRPLATGGSERPRWSSARLSLLGRSQFS